MNRVVLLAAVLLVARPFHPIAQSPPQQAVIDTTAGTFVIDLTPAAAPNQTAYFIKQATDGAYNGTSFHRVIKYGMVQGGDPLTKDASKRDLFGTGGLNAVNLKVAELYIAAFANLAKTGNTLIVPSNLADVATLVTRA